MSVDLVRNRLQLRAFKEGFHAGADPDGARRRHKVDPATHEAWRAGFQAGKEAAREASGRYWETLVQLAKDDLLPLLEGKDK